MWCRRPLVTALAALVGPLAAQSQKPAEIVVGQELPRTIDREGLSKELGAEVDRQALRVMRRQNLAGLAVGLVRGGKLVDVRSYGWEDVLRKIKATAATQYRWASISKTLTAVAAMQLAEQDKLDLDADVRSYVPEFPKKPHTTTSRQLLCHLGGITHYGANVIRSEVKYDEPHPFADRILALDMFKETPLVNEPGTKYSYTTHGYALLGAVVQRAGKQRYADQVQERIARPLGMKTLRPDHAWVDIPHRTPGYLKRGRKLYPSPDEDDVSWKLPGGGYISSVLDLGEYAAGVARGDLLRKETWKRVSTRQRTRDGEKIRYGLGFRVGDADGEKTLSHSGSQERTATYMVIAPRAKCAAVVMCNTQKAQVRRLGDDLLRLLLEAK